jgi:hypothetical protein
MARRCPAARRPCPPCPRAVCCRRRFGDWTEAAGDALLVEKLASDAEIVWRDEVERIGALARRGPALGLMGTLIPLGPALVGLAAGNLQMMSENLVIAFATTVIGLLVGTLAGAAVATKRRWYRADAALLAFAAGRVLQRESAPQDIAVRANHGGRSLGEPVARPAAQALAGNNGSKPADRHLQPAEVS